MKIKKINKKLTLNKKTVSNLDNSQMDKAQGGTGTITVDTRIPFLCCKTLGFECPPLVTWEFDTCDCTYECTAAHAGCPSAQG